MKRFDDLGISDEKLREAAKVIWVGRDDAVKTMLDYKREIPRSVARQTSIQKERLAYLAGVTAGLTRAVTEIEGRPPLKLTTGEEEW